MSKPSISQRKHYRQPPNEASEPTSTIVLTSQGSQFIDIRILKSAHQAESSQNLEQNSLNILQWAFAGTSKSTLGSSPNEPSHTVWTHWIDSKGSEGQDEVDEGDMYPQDNGDVLEKGVSKDPATGEEKQYEELWTELEIDVIPEEGGKCSTVLQAETASAQGMVIRVGGWCQGLLVEDGEKLTVERWRWASQENDPTQGPGYWKQIVRIGDGEMPGPVLLKGVDDEASTEVVSGGLKWEVVENHRWM